MSSGWFDHTKHPPTTFLLEEEGLQGGCSTPPNLLKPLSCMGKQTYKAVSSEFWVVRWFNHTEPPQTTVMQGEAGLQGSL